MPVLYQYGLRTASDAKLAMAIDMSVTDLQAQYPSREALVSAAVLADTERQKRDHVALYAEFSSAVERLYGLLRLGLRDLASIPAAFYSELQNDFPSAWMVVVEHLNTYSAPQLQQLLNDGIRSRLFRSDININLVTKVLIEQINMMLNPVIFPPDRYNMAEVFRSIFLYYIRGLCTDEGARVSADHFARI
ncbi:hypothetical protein BEN48_09690 [Hymenobacter glacialis]|uniref:Tetracyclin repressor-like C-terminal domain-containing protein n=2 Tax=Hymenobacter glacialis TaxID=1908236 RepID=A0A1G1TBX3_9BACT|nr:hypothetical protein BEN48_09690 [Hymenobacter glacialis]